MEIDDVADCDDEIRTLQRQQVGIATMPRFETGERASNYRRLARVRRKKYTCIESGCDHHTAHMNMTRLPCTDNVAPGEDEHG